MCVFILGATKYLAQKESQRRDETNNFFLRELNSWYILNCWSQFTFLHGQVKVNSFKAALLKKNGLKEYPKGAENPEDWLYLCFLLP